MDKKRYDEFEMYKEKLDEMYEKDPEKATMEAYNSLVRLGAVDGKTKKLSEGNFWIVCIVSVCVVIFLLGLFNIKSIMLYLFGFVFLLRECAFHCKLIKVVYYLYFHTVELV